MKLIKQILFPTLLVALTACTTVATSGPETVYVTEEVVPEEEFFSQAELDQMLAPIALYPDVLLSQVLMAATYPLEVVEASRWSKENPGLQGDEAVVAVESFNWDISIKPLVAFPALIQLLDETLTWPRQLGDAFLMQEADVMDSIQHLRQRSLDAGNLASLEHVRVEQEEEIIIIEPADVRVVYVPYYRPTIVYGDWWWYDYPPYYWDPPRRYYSSVGFHWGHGWHWSPGFHISTRFYYNFCDWHRRSIVVHHHHHHYDRHDWGRINRPPRHFDDSQVWKHNPHHRRGVDYRSDQLNKVHPRHSSSGRTTKPIMARPSSNPDDTQNNVLASNRPNSRRGSTQAGSGGNSNVRPERPVRPSPGGQDTGTAPAARTSAPTSDGSTVAANRTSRVSPSSNTNATRSAPVASRSQTSRVSSSDKVKTPSISRTSPRSSNSGTRYSTSRSSSTTSKPPVVNRSSSTTRSVPQTRNYSSRSSSRPAPAARSSSSGTTRSTPQARSSSSRSYSAPKARTSSSGSRQSSVSRSSSSSSRPTPQARSSSSSRSSSYGSRSSSSSRSSSYGSRSSSSSSGSRTSSSSGGGSSRPSAPARSSGGSSSNSRYSGGDDGGFRRG
ncbi:MAG: DUF3300 domain-containing protein [Puniceicoccaceae bacterium]